MTLALTKVNLALSKGQLDRRNGMSQKCVGPLTDDFDSLDELNRSRLGCVELLSVEQYELGFTAKCLDRTGNQECCKMGNSGLLWTPFKSSIFLRAFQVMSSICVVISTVQSAYSFCWCHGEEYGQEAYLIDPPGAPTLTGYPSRVRSRTICALFRRPNGRTAPAEFIDVDIRRRRNTPAGDGG